MTRDTLAQKWREAKAAEAAAITRRREIESEIFDELNEPESKEGTVKLGDGLKVRYSLSNNIDAQKLQELAREHGCFDRLGELFRWKPDINVREWRAAPVEVREALEPAITKKPAKPAFMDTKKEQ